MSQQSDERLPSSTSPAPRTSARILQFERPQSDLQRAVQMRAQEAIERDRDRDRSAKKPSPLRWITVLALAIIPVALIFGAVDGFVRALQKLNATYSSAPAAAPAPPPEPVQQQPQASAPGVIILQPLDAPKPADAPAPAEAVQREAPRANEASGAKQQ